MAGCVSLCARVEFGVRIEGSQLRQCRRKCHRLVYGDDVDHGVHLVEVLRARDDVAA